MHIANNFQNVAEQNLNIVVGSGAAAYNLASGSTADVTVANTRVGVGSTANLGVTNTAPAGSYTEVLNASFGGSSGAVNSTSGSITGGLGSGVAGGATNNSAMQVGIDTSTAGAKTGTVTLNYVSNGTGTSGLGNTNVGSQTIDVSGNVYQVAQPSLPTSVNLGNVHVGSSANQAINITNTNVAPGYQEGLDAGINSGSNASGSGSITNLAAGGSSTNISVGMTASAAGVNSGSVTLSLASNGTGTSGLSTLALSDKTVNTSITGYNLAQATINNPLDFNLGNILLTGGSVTKTVSITNSAASGIYSEALNAAFGTITNTGVGNVNTNNGSINGLLAGNTDALTMQVTYTPTAQGTINASVQLLLASNGTAIGDGLGITALPSQLLSLLGTVTGTVGTLAQAGPATPNPVNLGNVRVNTSAPSQALSIQNVATGPAEGLNATISTATPGLTASGSFSNLAAQAINNSNLVVGMNTSTAGSRNGTATITLASDGTFNGGVTTSLGTQTINVTGGVYQVAQPSIQTSVNLGNVRLGSGSNQTITIGNTNISPTGYQEGLDAAVGSQTNATGTGSITNLAAGGTSNAITVGMTASVAGVNTGSVALALASDGSTTSGLSTLSLGNQTVNTSITGYRLANPTLNTPSVTLYARVGDASPTASVSVTNTSPDIYTEGLNASIGTSSSGFTAGGSISNLAAQGTNSSAMQIGLGTGTAGTFGGTAALTLASTGAGTTGASDYSLTSQNVTLNGKVYQQAVATVNTPTVDFGIVHVGDTLGLTQGVSVTNSAQTAALNDVLTGSLSGATGPFTAGGTLGSGLAAGASSSSLTATLNTANAGIFSGTATAGFQSHNADMADLILANTTINLKAQVNNYANPDYQLVSGSGSLTHSSGSGLITLYDLNFGNVTQGSGNETAILNLLNDITGPADNLKGTFDLTGVNASDFLLAGFGDSSGNFSGITAGNGLNGLQITFETSTLGLGTFTDTIYLNATGYNDSGYSGQFAQIELDITGNVVGGQQAPVPEPATLLLIGSGLLGLAGMRRRFRK